MIDSTTRSKKVLAAAMFGIATLAAGPSYGQSCSGNCGESAGGCWCDDSCTGYGDCCGDYHVFCISSPPEVQPGSVPDYDPNKDYCGPWAVFLNPDVGDCLNHVCYLHDSCYQEQGVSVPCYWSGHSSSCDDAFFLGAEGAFACQNSGECGYMCRRVIERAEVLYGLRPVSGDWNYCSSLCPCGIGEGDCDGDGSTECEPGLVCVHNVGANYGFGGKVDVCEAPDGGGDDSCIGQCGGKSGDCWCDDACTGYSDCCSDYAQACGS